MSDPADIRGWQRLSSRITTSGRIEEGDLPRLSAVGVGHVVNLALDDHPEALADEAGKLAGAGIRYTHIPVPFDAPSEAQYRAFVEAIEDDAAPVHVHCIMNWRVAAFFYRYHVERGMAEAEARALMEVQWSPDTSDHPSAAPWAAFIGGKAG